MKFIVLLFWSLILSELAGFIIAKINASTLNPSLSAIIAVAFVIFIFVFDKVAILPDAKAYSAK